MAAIGSVQRGGCWEGVKDAPRWAIVGCAALAIIAVLAIALSAWSNVRIASLYGAGEIFRYSPGTIFAPFVLVSVCAAAVRALLIKRTLEATSPPTSTVESIIEMSKTAGMCHRIFVKAGDLVEPHTTVLEIEIMKMLISVPAGHHGRIAEILVPPQSHVEKGAPLFRLEKAAAESRDDEKSQQS